MSQKITKHSLNANEDMVTNRCTVTDIKDHFWYTTFWMHHHQHHIVSFSPLSERIRSEELAKGCVYTEGLKRINGNNYLHEFIATLNLFFFRWTLGFLWQFFVFLILILKCLKRWELTELFSLEFFSSELSEQSKQRTLKRFLPNT